MLAAVLAQVRAVVPDRVLTVVLVPILALARVLFLQHFVEILLISVLTAFRKDKKIFR